jgi:hypothetical protein
MRRIVHAEVVALEPRDPTTLPIAEKPMRKDAIIQTIVLPINKWPMHQDATVQTVVKFTIPLVPALLAHGPVMVLGVIAQIANFKFSERFQSWIGCTFDDDLIHRM